MEESQIERPRRRSRARLRLLALASAVALIGALAAVLVPHSAGAVRDLFRGFGVAAPLICLAAWALLTAALVPGTLLAGATGLALGTGAGVMVALAGATLGSVVAFLLARRVGGDALDAVSRGRVASVKQRLEGGGWITVAALRAAPGIPATWLNYAVGLSRVPLRSFALGVAVGGAPRVFAYTALGGSLGHLGSPTAIVAIGVLAAMTVAGGVLAWRTARRAQPLRA